MNGILFLYTGLRRIICLRLKLPVETITDLHHPDEQASITIFGIIMASGLRVTDAELSSIIGAVYLVATSMGALGIKLIWQSYCNSKLRKEGIVYLDERPANIDGLSLYTRFRNIRNASLVTRTIQKSDEERAYVQQQHTRFIGLNEIIILTAFLFLSFMGIGQVVTPLGIRDSGIRDISFSQSNAQSRCLPTETGDTSQEPFMAQAVELVTNAHCAGLDSHTQVGSIGRGIGSIYSAEGRPESAGDLVTAAKLNGSFEFTINYGMDNSVGVGWDTEKLAEIGPEANIGDVVRELFVLQRSVLPLVLTGGAFFTQLRSTREKEQLVGFACNPRERGPWELGTTVTVTLDCWSFLNEISGTPGISLLSIRPTTIAQVVEAANVEGSCKSSPGGRSRSDTITTEYIEETARLTAATQQIGIILAIGEECNVGADIMKVPTQMSTLSKVLISTGAGISSVLLLVGVALRILTRKTINWCGDDDRIINLASNRQETIGGNCKDLSGTSGIVAVIMSVAGGKGLHLKSFHEAQIIGNFPELAKYADPDLVNATGLVARRETE